MSTLGEFSSTTIGARYLRANDLKDKPPLVLTIKSVETRELKGKTKLILSFHEINEQMVCNRTNVAYLKERLGAGFPINQLIGHKITIAAVPVQYANQVVQGLRILAVD